MKKIIGIAMIVMSIKQVCVLQQYNTKQMEFKHRLTHKRQYYDTLVDWWESHKAFGNKVIEYDRMPDRVFIVSKGGEDLFAISVYVSDSTICWIGWITSNPTAKIKNKYKALEYLYDAISKDMSKQGYDCIISKTNERGLAKALENSAFVLTEQSNFYIKNI